MDSQLNHRYRICSFVLFVCFLRNCSPPCILFLPALFVFSFIVFLAHVFCTFLLIIVFLGGDVLEMSLGCADFLFCIFFLLGDWMDETRLNFEMLKKSQGWFFLYPDFINCMGHAFE